MLFSWWWLWIVFMFLAVAPMGYGWGYRGWGAPYPRYIQRRRGQRAASAGGPVTFDHHSWGWGGDFVWMILFIAVFWACFGIWWR